MTAFVSGLMTWTAAPPDVRDQITSKIWTVTMNSTAIATVNGGRSIGNVTARNTWAGRAPSTRAASTTSWGIDCNAASSTTMAKGNRVHTCATATQNNCADGDASQ